MRLRVVAYTAQRVRVVCSVSVLFVCTLFASGALHEVSPHWPLPARLPKGETSVHCTPDVQDIHSPNLCARSTRILSHLLSPGLQGTKAASARCVNPCLANLLGMAWKCCCAIGANARGAYTLAGSPGSPLRAVFHRNM